MIGRPIDRAMMATAQLILGEGVAMEAVQEGVS